MIAEFLARIFATRNAAHLAHLRTRSYAQHMALGSFYEDIIGAADAVAEAWMGAFGKLPALPDLEDEAGDIIERLREEADWLEVNREEIANDHNAVANLVDGVTAIYLSTIYKLTQLS